MVDLLTDEQRALLLANGRITAEGQDHDPFPVVKLFTPDAGATWLLTEINPDEPDIAFGLCDLGSGHPEIGHVRLSDLAGMRGPLKQPVELDPHFRPDRPLSRYYELALARGYVQT
ncbi:DUF2958 domain-containing protein [Methylobacterium oryzihabitans]|uniref:DUF2958 domain-containing protein n=1 Tax=Methylobacterium oryzihabitans TaxID=2499852 RepID=A0A3S2VVC7_9HYPH|nr:DUF2958 domain-containing protein [Methylobacterium oryzihabitans]RVU18487.1 DUF2958 domain-containing protein [Methylobacterium oryzihabitans]